MAELVGWWELDESAPEGFRRRTGAKPDGWLPILGSDGVRYGCQTRRVNWWCRVSGIATVFDVGEAAPPHTHPNNRVPDDVIAAADAACPDRLRPSPEYYEELRAWIDSRFQAS